MLVRAPFGVSELAQLGPLIVHIFRDLLGVPPACVPMVVAWRWCSGCALRRDMSVRLCTVRTMSAEPCDRDRRNGWWRRRRKGRRARQTVVSPPAALVERLVDLRGGDELFPTAGHARARPGAQAGLILYAVAASAGAAWLLLRLGNQFVSDIGAFLVVASAGIALMLAATAWLSRQQDRERARKLFRLGRDVANAVDVASIVFVLVCAAAGIGLALTAAYYDRRDCCTIR